MEQLAAITEAVDALERVLADLAAIASREDDRRRHDLVALRRVFATRIAEVGRRAEPVFGTSSDRDMVQAYRDRFSRMRSAAAMHQANWPAVKLTERPEEYRASARGVSEVNREFIAWMREALARLGRAGSGSA